MLKRRVIFVLTFVDGVLFRSKEFTPDYRYTSNFIDTWSVDEIVALDITRNAKPFSPEFLDAIDKIARRCFVPLAVGGGVRTVDDFHLLLRRGADKVVVNTGGLQNPDLITQAAKSFGAQCVVASIDTRKRSDGTYGVYQQFGAVDTGREASAWAKEAQDLGAGEILVTSIERDGSLLGYDLNLCKLVSAAVSIPVLISGGAGNWQHFTDGFITGGAEGVCTSNIYHLTETSIKSAKIFLEKRGVPIRPVRENSTNAAG